MDWAPFLMFNLLGSFQAFTIQSFHVWWLIIRKLEKTPNFSSMSRKYVCPAKNTLFRKCTVYFILETKLNMCVYRTKM